MPLLNVSVRVPAATAHALVVAACAARGREWGRDGLQRLDIATDSEAIVPTKLPTPCVTRPAVVRVYHKPSE